MDLLQCPGTGISIHALLAESDNRQRFLGQLYCNYFYPRSPCGERLLPLSGTSYSKKFLSTLSLRRATLAMWTERPHSKDFYPRSPCGERPISATHVYPVAIFLSTLSLRRATISRTPQRNRRTISIHALLAESDPIARRSRSFRSISIHALLAESDGRL